MISLGTPGRSSGPQAKISRFSHKVANMAVAVIGSRSEPSCTVLVGSASTRGSTRVSPSGIGLGIHLLEEGARNPGSASATSEVTECTCRIAAWMSSSFLKDLDRHAR